MRYFLFFYITSIFYFCVFFRVSYQFIIDVIPSGNMRWDNKSQSFKCQKGEDQCSRQILQYCAIREYSFELSHQFVRCMQLYVLVGCFVSRTPGTSASAYSVCKRFSLLQYSLIDECVRDREQVGF